jgi:NAD(P)-dependent dehydrogenase (short-subunit alcohol dehydrogenase family)
MRDLQGRVAVVTGSAQGIGRALALQCARAGMHVALADIDAPRLGAVADEVESLGARALCVVTDVRDPDAVAALLEQTLAELGGCHLVMNNAGVFHAGLMLDSPLEQWRRVLDTNLWGVIHGCRVFGSHFAKQRVGHIVNTASAAGLLAVPGMSSYSTTKFAVVGLSQQLRWELAASGVGVTWLCPGIVRNTGITKPTEVGLDHLDMDLRLRRYPTPEKLAKRTLVAVRRNLPVVLYGADAHLANVLRRLPASFMDPLGRLFLGQAHDLLRGQKARTNDS